MTHTGESQILRCSWCNKSDDEVQKMIAGPTAFICDECVDICYDITAEHFYRATSPDHGYDAAAHPVREIRCALCRRHSPVEQLLILRTGALCADCVSDMWSTVSEMLGRVQAS